MWKSHDSTSYSYYSQGFWRRRELTALPLLKERGIGALLLENPFYGTRKPKGQTRSQLNHVSDLLVMGLSLVLECINLIGWLQGRSLGPVGLTGISMGGHVGLVAVCLMAVFRYVCVQNVSLTACVYPQSVPVVPCLSWSTAACVFTEVCAQVPPWGCSSLVTRL